MGIEILGIGRNTITTSYKPALEQSTHYYFINVHTYILPSDYLWENIQEDNVNYETGPTALVYV